MATFVRVAAVTDVPPGSLAAVEVEGVDLCLANADGTIYAFHDNCSHEDQPLHTGELEGGRVECESHGARFDVATGRPVSLPAVKPIKVYEVKIEGDDILVAL